MSRLLAAMRWTTGFVLCLALTGCRVLTFVGDVWDHGEFDFRRQDPACKSNCKPKPYVGLGSYWTPRDDFTVERLAHKCFDHAWEDYLAHCSRPPSKHFRNGFEDAFDEIADGGDGVIPPIPPKKYWNTYYRSPEGKFYAQQWFNGYQVGVDMARAAGLDNMRQIATSIPQPCGCGGRGCQQCSGGAMSSPNDPSFPGSMFGEMPGGIQSRTPYDSPANSRLTPIPEPYPSSVLTNPASPVPAKSTPHVTPTPPYPEVPALPQPGSATPIVPNPDSPTATPSNSGFLPQPNSSPATVPFSVNPQPNPNSIAPDRSTFTPSRATPTGPAPGHSIPPASEIT
ncbi:MAG: hypothetical protein O3A00_25945, partial [Planctomycetota bacterium]|nr:hypothetical protein [Planctomycetota bacterium]